MPRALSLDLRRRVVEAYENGEGTYAEIAQRFGVGEASVSRWLSLKREQGHLRRRKQRSGPRRKMGPKHDDALLALVEANNDLTIGDYRDLLEEETGLDVSDATVGRALRRLGLSRKKRR